MLPDDAPADRQAQPGTFTGRFGSKKRCHYFGQVGGCYPCARVLYLQNHRTVIPIFRINPDGKIAALGHGITGIGKKIEKQLLQFLALGLNQWQVGLKILDDVNSPFAEMKNNQLQGVIDFCAYIQAANPPLLVTAEIQQIMDKRRHTVGFLVNHPQGALNGIRGSKLSGQQFYP